MLVLSLDLGLRDTKLFLNGFKFIRDLAQVGLQLTSTLRVRVTIAAKRGVAFAKDGNLVDLLRKLAVLSLRDCRLNGTLALL